MRKKATAAQASPFQPRQKPQTVPFSLKLCLWLEKPNITKKKRRYKAKMANSSGEVQEGQTVVVQEEEAHPYAFHVSGPRNVASPNWRDLINSSWSVLFIIITTASRFIFSLFVLYQWFLFSFGYQSIVSGSWSVLDLNSQKQRTWHKLATGFKLLMWWLPYF